MTDLAQLSAVVRLTGFKLFVRSSGAALFAFFIFVLAPVSHAHELRPGYLDIGQTGPDTYDVVWKVPSIGGRPLRVEPRFASHCTVSNTDRQSAVRSVVRNATLTCESPLTAEPIELAGLDATLTDVLVRVRFLHGGLQTLRATPDSPSVLIASPETAQGIAHTYFELGVEHILLGFDHLLFVLALVLIIPTWQRLVATVTAFTLAHSITLAAASLGWVSLPGRSVEALIALSIVFLANEIASKQVGVTRPTERWPWLIAFAFGLLHGFGFAGALSEIGLPKHDVPVALLTFNFGVEAGQLVFLGMVSVVLVGLNRVGLRERFDTAASYAIGATASFWLIERLV